MSFTAAGLAAARAVRDAFTIVVEVIDALIPAEAIDQAEALAKAEEEREVWEPGESAWALQKLVETPPLGTPGGETPRSAAGYPPGHLTSYDASWAAAIVQSRGLDLPLGSRARAAVMSLAERLQALADAEAERDAWEPVETESPAAAMNFDVNITDPADRWDQ